VTPRRPARQILTVVAAIAVVGVFLWYRNQAPVMSGTKATFTLVGTSATPAGGPGGGTRTTTSTTTSTATSATTATTAGDR